MIKKFVFKSLMSVIALFFLFGCAEKEHVPIPSFTANQFDANIYAPKVDNFLIVFDASISMKNVTKEEVKLDIAKAIVDRLNQTIPEMGQTAGVRSFGHAPEVSKAYTNLLYGMEKYSTQDLGNQLNVTKAGGLSKLNAALDAASMDFEGQSGAQNAVIIISDGLDMGNEALVSAQSLKDKFGSSICFYTIQVGEAPEGKDILAQIVDIGGCGFYSTSGGLLTSSGMAGFVEKVFLDEKPAPVVKKAPTPVVVAKKDDDKDGVYNEDDKCPNTPEGANVNSVGCWSFNSTALFDFDKSDIKPEAYPMLGEAVKILEKNPSMGVTLKGYTDNVGNEEYNMGLSLRRANTIKAYFIQKGITESRLVTEGFGSKNPVAMNDSETGRSLNRRVELHPR